VPLIILAGKEYGSGSSRDWRRKARKLLGVARSSRRASSAFTAATS
jgi:aconitase A